MSGAAMTRRWMSLWYDLYAVDNLAGIVLDGAMAGEMHPFDFAVYSLLLKTPLTPGRIADELSVSPSTLSGVLARLEEQGHARRIPNPDDARSRIVELTEDGRAAHAKASQRFLDVDRPVRQALGDDYEWVIWALHRIDHALRRVQGVDQGPPPLAPPAAGDPFADLGPTRRRELERYAAYLRWNQEAGE
jgi:DNA-binding MarR family transcriptional regulator